jgi:signal recognition particle receptor subunit beta
LSFINYSSREIILKIVYYGPGLCGKTTNIKFIYAATNPDARGKLISLETKQERTLFFDFLPLSLPAIRGFKTRLHLYTVPGQLFYSASRKLIMKGADGVIFVADSQTARHEANLISLEDLQENLEAYGYDITRIPFVVQYNKRDLPEIMDVEALRKDLNLWSAPDFESIASAPNGPGVFETLKAVAKMILVELRRGSPSN